MPRRLSPRVKVIKAQNRPLKREMRISFSFLRLGDKREILLHTGFSLPRRNREPVDYAPLKSFHL